MASPSVTVRVNLGEFHEQLASWRDHLLARIQRGMNVGLRRTQTFIMREELAGQILNRRTRKLVRSVRIEPAAFVDDRIVGAVLAGGGPAWYARVHEYGGLKAYTIMPKQAQALRWVIQGPALSRHGLARFAKVVHHPPLKARPFMRPALETQASTIVRSIREELGRS